MVSRRRPGSGRGSDRPRSAVGERIHERLTELDWSQARLAEQVGCSEKHLSNVMRARKRMSASLAARIEGALSLDAEDLMALDVLSALDVARQTLKQATRGQ